MSPKKKKNTGRTVLSVLLALVLIGTALIAGAYFGIKHYDNAYDLFYLWGNSSENARVLL